MNPIRAKLSSYTNMVLTVGILALFVSAGSALNEVEDSDLVEMKPPLESAVNYYDKFYNSFNRFTRDVPLVHFGRYSGPDFADEQESDKEAEFREKRAVKFEDSSSKASESTPGKKNYEVINSESATLAFGPAALTVSTGDAAKHFGGFGGGYPGGYPGGFGGGYYPGGGYGNGYYPGGGLGGGYPGGHYGQHLGGSSSGASAFSGPGGSFANANGGGYHQGQGGYPGGFGGGYYPGGGYGNGYYPGGGLGGGYPGGYPGGFGGGFTPGFGGGLYNGFGGGPYGYGRTGNDDKENLELKNGKQSSSAPKPASASSAVKFSSN